MDMPPKTLLEAVSYFADPDNCREYLVARRWPNGVTCPTCGSKSVYFDTSRNGWECKTRHPKRKFTLKTGTIFEDSPLGLDKWLPAVWMIANCKNGVSRRTRFTARIGVTQKTAWFMLQRIRLAMQDERRRRQARRRSRSGRNLHRRQGAQHARGASASARHLAEQRRWLGKVAVMGLLERHGETGSSTVRTASRRGRASSSNLQQPSTRARRAGRDGLHRRAALVRPAWTRDYVHHVIDHAETYVDGNVHTNGLENFWSLLKRALKGTYVSVEPFHLFRYLDEQAFRFNNRTLTDAERFALAITGIVGKRLTYAELIGTAESQRGPRIGPQLRRGRRGRRDYAAFGFGPRLRGFLSASAFWVFGLAPPIWSFDTVNSLSTVAVNA